MALPDPATRAAARMVAEAWDAVHGADRLVQDPETAISATNEGCGDNPWFDRACFRWASIEPQLDRVPYHCEVPEDYTPPQPPECGGHPEHYFNYPRRRWRFVFPSTDAKPEGSVEEIELFNEDGAPSTTAIAVVRAWGRAIVELGNRLLPAPDREALPEPEELELGERERAFYVEVRTEYLRRRSGLDREAINERVNAKHGIKDWFVDEASTSRTKRAVNEALKEHGLEVLHRPKRGGYVLSR